MTNTLKNVHLTQNTNYSSFRRKCFVQTMLLSTLFLTNLDLTGCSFSTQERMKYCEGINVANKPGSDVAMKKDKVANFLAIPLEKSTYKYSDLCPLHYIREWDTRNSRK